MFDSPKFCHPEHSGQNSEERVVAWTDDPIFQLRRRCELLELATETSEALLAAAEVASVMPALLPQLARAIHADRSIIGRIEPPDDQSPAGWLVIDHEWTAPGIPRQSDDQRLRRMDMANYEDILCHLASDRIIQVLTSDLTGQARQEQIDTGCVAQVMISIQVDGQTWGFFGFDDCRTARVWDEAEVGLLQIAATAFASAIQRENLAEARLRAVRETERERAAAAEQRTAIARELHDNLAQCFTGISLQIEAAEMVAEHGRPPDPHYLRAKELARLGLSEARRSALALSPAVLEENGLLPALHLLAERATVEGRIECQFQTSGPPRPLTSAQDRTLFRVAQESVHNAIRHGRATRIDLAVAFLAESCVIEIADNGVGLDPSTHLPGTGLANLQTAVSAGGGVFNIAPLDPTGTLVTATLPLAKSHSAP